MIDYNDDAKSPDYQQGTESGSNGSNIGGSVNATMFDHPTTSGGNKGFFDLSRKIRTAPRKMRTAGRRSNINSKLTPVACKALTAGHGTRA